jgi:hypothetical protein
VTSTGGSTSFPSTCTADCVRTGPGDVGLLGCWDPALERLGVVENLSMRLATKEATVEGPALLWTEWGDSSTGLSREPSRAGVARALSGVVTPWAAAGDQLARRFSADPFHVDTEAPRDGERADIIEILESF